MKILFLDDDLRRRKIASRELRVGNALCIVEDANQAILSLTEMGPFDEVYLDHDLGGEIFVGSELPDTGMEVVRWIVEHKPEIGKVIVHSLNEVGADMMATFLRDAGYIVEKIGFIALAKQWGELW